MNDLVKKAREAVYAAHAEDTVDRVIEITINTIYSEIVALTTQEPSITIVDPSEPVFIGSGQPCWALDEPLEESDIQFLRRLEPGLRYGDEVFTDEERLRLLNLAIRGAGTLWRPIQNAPTDGTRVLVYARLNPPEKWHESIRDLPLIVCEAAYHPDAGWCVCEYREVTHYIPLTMLGEPSDAAGK